jgi:antitoxin ParD1/3/4
MRDRDAAVERWLRDEVIAGHQEYLADPSQGVPAEEILDRIWARRRELAAAGGSHAPS